jgi:hypothetical protein
MAQVVEHLPTKCVALSSNPNTTKKIIITAENSPNLINMDIWIYKAQKFPQTHATQRGLLQDTL